MPEQEVRQPRKKKQKQAEPEFSLESLGTGIGDLGDLKKDEIDDISLEYGLYKARKGQGGDRRLGAPPRSPII